VFRFHTASLVHPLKAVVGNEAVLPVGLVAQTTEDVGVRQEVARSGFLADNAELKEADLNHFTDFPVLLVVANHGSISSLLAYSLSEA